MATPPVQVGGPDFPSILLKCVREKHAPDAILDEIRGVSGSPETKNNPRVNVVFNEDCLDPDPWPLSR